MPSWSELGFDESKLKPGEQKIPCHWCSPSRRHPDDTSLSVNTDSGIYHCFNCERKGKVGGRDYMTRPANYAKREWKKPDAEVYQSSVVNPTAAILGWFKERGISEQTLLDHRVSCGEGFQFKIKTGQKNDRGQEIYAWPDDAPNGGPVYAIFFPYYRGEELVNVKARRFDQKDFRLKPGAEKILWMIDRADTTTIICEGEVDLLSFYEAGYSNVVSVPNGANVSEYLVACTEELRAVERFILCTDGDEKGVICRNQLATQLGKEICLYPTYPEGCKDANEIWVKHGKQGIDDLVASARYFPIDGLISIRDLAEELEYYYDYGMPKGSSTGFPSLDALMKIPTGSFSVWTGRPSMGKSTVLSQVLINLAEIEKWPIGIFSAEDSPTASLAVKLMMKHVGKPFDLEQPGRMSRGEMHEALDWLDRYFHPIAPTSATWSVEEVLKLARSAVFQYGIRALALDPWNEFDHARPKNMGEQDYYSHVLSMMRQFGRDNDCHVFLVAHPRKGEAFKKDGEMIELPPHLDDVAGSAAFRAKADFGVVVHRSDEGEHMVDVNVLKVRQPWHGKKGKVTLGWDPKTGRVFDPQTGPKPLSDEQLQELENW